MIKGRGNDVWRWTEGMKEDIEDQVTVQMLPMG
jgi:hypothetical protein